MTSFVRPPPTAKGPKHRRITLNLRFVRRTIALEFKSLALRPDNPERRRITDLPIVPSSV